MSIGGFSSSGKWHRFVIASVALLSTCFNPMVNTETCAGENFREVGRCKDVFPCVSRIRLVMRNINAKKKRKVIMPPFASIFFIITLLL